MHLNFCHLERQEKSNQKQKQKARKFLTRGKMYCFDRNSHRVLVCRVAGIYGYKGELYDVENIELFSNVLSLNTL